jgi:hypothetical protein
MSHACCTACRLRFAPADAAHLTLCPRCGQPVQALRGPDAAFGLRLFTHDGAPRPMPAAGAMAMPVPDPGRSRS